MTKTGDLDFLSHLKIEDKIEIAGFQANIENVQETLETFNNISDGCEGCIIQLMDAKGIAGKKHLWHGIIHGLNSFKRGENLANNLGIEICIRLTAQRQISKALDILGLKKGKMNIAAVLINCPDNTLNDLNKIFLRDDSVLESNSELKDIYDISDKEIDLMDIEDILIDRSTELIVEI